MYSASLRLVVRQGDSPCSAVAAQTGADFIPVFLTYAIAHTLWSSAFIVPTFLWGIMDFVKGAC